MTTTCPVCGTPTPPSRAGHRTLCLPCTETEIGETYVQLRGRVGAMYTRGKKGRRR